MSKYIYFIKNAGVVALGQFGSKIISFFMVPFYTTFLSTYDYGVFDFINTIVTLSIPIFVLNIQTAVLRFVIDKNYKKSDIFKIAITINALGTICFSFVIILNSFIKISETLAMYNIEVVLIFWITSFYHILSEYMRGLGKLSDVAVSGVINTGFFVLFNVIFLTVINWGVQGLLISNILGLFFCSIYLLFKVRPLKLFFSGGLNKKEIKEMLIFSIPMSLNSISWWLNDVAGRYIIIALVGMAANGVYAISRTIVSIFIVIQNVFDQAWVISSLKEFSSDDRDAFYLKMYNLYNCFLVHISLIIFIFVHVLADFLFKGEFTQAWIYVPFLILSALFGALSGFIGVIFSAVKNTELFAKTTVFGAVSNLVLCYLLIELWGTIGASIAAFISSLIVWLARIYYAKRYVDINWIEKRNLLAYIILIIQAIILINYPISIELVVSFIFAIVIFAFIYNEYYIMIMCKIKLLNK